MSFKSPSTDVAQKLPNVVVHGVDMPPEVFSLCCLVGTLRTLVMFYQAGVRRLAFDRPMSGSVSDQSALGHTGVTTPGDSTWER